jgi:Tfp pilus assembly PilM family ATPase
MARSRYGLGLEFLEHEIRLALVEDTDTETTLIKTSTIGRREDLARAVRALGRRPGGVTCAVPLNCAAVRLLDLPPMGEENIERIVMMEAETVLPLDREQLALAHHVLGMTDQSRIEVLVAAGRQSVVQDTLRRANFSSFVSATANVSSIALLNAIRHWSDGEADPVCAVLRLEASESELAVFDRNRPIAAQVLQVGAGSTGAAAPTHGSEQEPWVDELARQARFCLNAVELSKGHKATRLYLCGGGVGSGSLDWYLGEQLSIPVTILDPSADQRGGGAPYAVAYGCAVQALDEAVLPLNLTPTVVAVAREVEQRRQVRFAWTMFGVAAAAAIVLLIAAAFAYQDRELAMVTEKLSQLPQSARKLKPEAKPSVLKDAVEAVTEAAEARVPAAHAIGLLNQGLPSDVWLAEMTYNAESGAVTRGYAQDPASPQMAQASLLASKAYDEVTLDYQTAEKLGDRDVWSFQLTCKLRPKEKKTRRGTAGKAAGKAGGQR